jgi:hypothetical protein
MRSGDRQKDEIVVPCPLHHRADFAQHARPVRLSIGQLDDVANPHRLQAGHDIGGVGDRPL